MPPKNRPERSDHSDDYSGTPTVPAGLAEELGEMIPLMTRTELIRIVDVAVQAALAAQQRRVEQPQPAPSVSALEQYRAMRLAKPQTVQSSGSGSKRKWTGSSSSSSMFKKKRPDNPRSSSFPLAPSRTQMNRHRREPVRQNPFHFLSSTANVKCYNCCQYGHYQTDCPFPLRSRPGRSSVASLPLPISTVTPQPTETQRNQSSMPTSDLQTQIHVPSTSNANEHPDLVTGNVTIPSIP